MLVLKGRVGALVGTFNKQNVANMLRSYAKMERVPGGDVVDGGAEGGKDGFHGFKHLSLTH
jgi:hypothetical protein